MLLNDRVQWVVEIVASETFSYTNPIEGQSNNVEQRTIVEEPCYMTEPWTPLKRSEAEILSKSIKSGLKGTNITEKDAKEIIDGVQAMYDKIPSLFRSMLPSLPDVLKRIPPSAGKYTLDEIIQLLDWAYENGHLKR